MSNFDLTKAWRQQTKTPSEKLVLVCLADHRNGETGQCNPSIEVIAKECNLKPRQVQKILASLRAQGLIDWTRRRREKQWALNHYRFPWNDHTHSSAGDQKTITCTPGSGEGAITCTPGHPITCTPVPTNQNLEPEDKENQEEVTTTSDLDVSKKTSGKTKTLPKSEEKSAVPWPTPLNETQLSKLDQLAAFFAEKGWNPATAIPLCIEHWDQVCKAIWQEYGRRGMNLPTTATPGHLYGHREFALKVLNELEAAEHHQREAVEREEAERVERAQRMADDEARRAALQARLDADDEYREARDLLDEIDGSSPEQFVTPARRQRYVDWCPELHQLNAPAKAIQQMYRMNYEAILHAARNRIHSETAH